MQPSVLHKGNSASHVMQDDNARLGQTKDPELSDEDRRGPFHAQASDKRTVKESLSPKAYREALARGFVKKAESLLKARNKPGAARAHRYPQTGDTE
jgi:hypothetical protein